METYKKDEEGKLQIEEVQTKSRIYSYDRILNEIQELKSKLVYWKKLKAEADKLGLTR